MKLAKSIRILELRDVTLAKVDYNGQCSKIVDLLLAI